MAEFGINAGEVTRVLVASGDDKVPCVEAFQEATGIEVPNFSGEQDEVEAGEVLFMSVKGSDVPGMLEDPNRLEPWEGVTVGLSGSDTLKGASYRMPSVSYMNIGERMCTFSLMAPDKRVGEALDVLDPINGGRSSGRLEPTLTSFPDLLGLLAAEQDLPVKATDWQPRGSVEMLIARSGLRLGADLVVSGETARQNNVTVLPGYDLYDVYPAIAWRKPDAPAPSVEPRDGIDRVDATFDMREGQVNDDEVSSYTLNLMRDPKKARGKLADESGELYMAIGTDQDVDVVTGEAADVVYAAITYARSRGIPLTLQAITRELVLRNIVTTSQQGEWQ